MYDDLGAFLNYIYSSPQQMKYQNLLPAEQVLLYYFDQLEERTQQDLMRYIYEKSRQIG